MTPQTLRAHLDAIADVCKSVKAAGVPIDVHVDVALPLPAFRGAYPGAVRHLEATGFAQRVEEVLEVELGPVTLTCAVQRPIAAEDLPT